MADLAGVRTFADSVESVDVLVNNAGVMGVPLSRAVDGVEAHMGTNHLGHFASTDLPSDTYLAPRFNQFGPPQLTKVRPKSSDPVMARRLWELSAELTGCDWPGV